MTSTNDMIRRIYHVFRAGARLRSDDIERLFAKAGNPLSKNRLRELGRDSDRGKSITIDELYLLIAAWADEQRGDRQ